MVKNPRCSNFFLLAGLGIRAGWGGRCVPGRLRGSRIFMSLSAQFCHVLQGWKLLISEKDKGSAGSTPTRLRQRFVFQELVSRLSGDVRDVTTREIDIGERSYYRRRGK